MKETTLIQDGATLSAGLALRWIINHGFDYVLYPVVLVAFGTTVGGIILTILALIINVLIIRAYDWSQTDWLLIEKLKSKVHDESHTGIKGRIFDFIRRNNVLMFFVLNLDDPITATLYLREGAYQYNGLTKRDWGIYIASNIVSNFYWIIGWSLIIEAFKYVYMWLQTM